MKLHTHHTLLRLVVICCGLMLTLLLAACNTSGQGTTTIPTPTPTPAPALTSYSGEGYTIGYPKSWTYKKYTGQNIPTNTFIGDYIKSFSSMAPQVVSQISITTLTDSLGVNTLTIGTVPNPNGTISSQTALGVATSAFQSAVKSYKKDSSVAAQTTVGGQTWDQTAATGNITQQQAIDAKTVALISNYPAQSASTKLYFIVYAGPASTFDNVNSTGFQPMLQSFKFS